MAATNRLTPEEADHAFYAKLKRMSLSILKAAEGRTCNQCFHSVLTSEGGAGFCSKYTNYTGASLQIVRAAAPACATGFQPVDS